MGKRLLASFLAAAMMLTMAPFAFAADDSVASVTSVDGTVTNYTSLATALSRATEGSTVTLLHDTNVGGMTPTISKKNITVDLGGYTVTGIAQQTFGIEGNNAVLKNGKIVNNCTKNAINAIRVDRDITVTLENIKTECSQYGLQLGTTAYRAMTVNITGDETNITGGVAAIAVQNSTVSNKGAAVSDILTLNISGGTISSEAYAIAGNGKEHQGNTIINITGGVISSSKDTAIYHPQAGKLNISGGTITGVTGGVQMCSGSLNVTGGAITATGKDKTSTKTGDGSIPDGAAVSVVNRSYPGGTPSATISGGTLTSASGVDAVQAYTWTDGSNAKSDWAEAADHIGISGGTFSSNVSAYVASGYEVVQDGDSHTVKAESVAEVGGVGYASLQEAFSAAESGKTVKLLADVTVDKEDTVAARTTIIKPITLDLNGKTIIGPDDMGKNNTNFCMLIVDADTTIIDSANGGGIDAGKNGGYCINIRNGATLTINAGKYYGGGTDVQVQKGTLIVNGGTFDAEPFGDPYGYNFMINCIDSAYQNGTAKVLIKGGTFVNFDPAHGPEQGNPSFCAPGYKTELTNGVYVVKAGTNDAINAIDEAIKDGATKEKIKAAVDAVASTPNATLANSSTTMDKLAKLEEVYTNANTGASAITVEVENGTATKEPDTKLQAAKNAALSASAGDTITINVDKADAATQTAVANAIGGGAQVEALDITMKKGDGTAITVPDAPVVLTFKLPTDKANATIYRIENDTATEIPTSLNVASDGSRTISGTFEHFSTYGIKYQAATANDNKYEFTLIPDKTDVSAGDTLTYTVKLKYISGDGSPVGSFRFTPTIKNNELLELQSAAPAEGTNVKWTDISGQYEFTLTSLNKPVSVTKDNPYTVGTLVYKVKGYGTTTEVVVNGDSNDQVSNQDLKDAVTPTVGTSTTVTYHVTRVTFHEDDSKADIVRYVPYKGSDLYENLGQMAEDRENKKVNAPQLTDDTNNTKYRLKDINWHLNSKTGTVYDANTKYITDTTYYANTVELVPITLPTDNSITIDDNLLHKRPNDPYVDKTTDLPFTVGTPTTPGMKYDVVVKVNGQEVPDNQIDWTKDTDGKIIGGTVKGAAVTGDVTFKTTPVVNLTANDIYIFTSGEGTAHAYVEYSKYSGSDTLVLIKGKAGANYTLPAGQPTIYRTDGYKTLPGGEWTHAVLVPKLTDVNADDTVNKQKMLTELLGMGLTATADANQVIDTTRAARWDTNGNGKTNRDLGDVQAANDFKSRTEAQLKWTPTDDLLLLADVVTITSDSANKYQESSYDKVRDGQVDDNDVNAFVYLYAKMG